MPGLFSDNYIFSSFCPYCTLPTTATVYITCTDSYGDGWEGNSLAVKQSNWYAQFGQNFLDGHEYPYTILINVTIGVNFTVVPYVLGGYTS